MYYDCDILDTVRNAREVVELKIVCLFFQKSVNMFSVFEFPVGMFANYRGHFLSLIFPRLIRNNT